MTNNNQLELKKELLLVMAKLYEELEDMDEAAKYYDIAEFATDIKLSIKIEVQSNAYQNAQNIMNT